MASAPTALENEPGNSNSSIVALFSSHLFHTTTTLGWNKFLARFPSEILFAKLKDTRMEGSICFKIWLEKNFISRRKLFRLNVNELRAVCFKNCCVSTPFPQHCQMQRSTQRESINWAFWPGTIYWRCAGEKASFSPAFILYTDKASKGQKSNWKAKHWNKLISVRIDTIDTQGYFVSFPHFPCTRSGHWVWYAVLRYQLQVKFWYLRTSDQT